jgi:ribonuclease HI
VTALKLFFDGGCRPNPGPIEVAVVARGRTYLKTGLGVGSNDDAEWLALLYALDVARDLGISDPLFVGDSTLVVKQASGAWPCHSPNLQQHLDSFRRRAQAFDRIGVRYIRRSHNLAGIALAATRTGLLWRP